MAATITECAIADAKAGRGIVTSKLDGLRTELEGCALVRILSDRDFGSLEANALFANGKTIEPATHVHGFVHWDFDTGFTEHSRREWT
ncbi:hypothetical protein [Bradyrhizobium sp. BRP56]|uniref:hypothetical protein n=1 Tax=Bradyrhizobium sp. BRP56 TaxID=2793819 RepID=UPI001CD6727D|nr:hypothetical protein [Bradyrhizobium sp. BRP56]MCA1396261.1 hypothetical protein [Bradyrhizobium sp. BRP56]